VLIARNGCEVAASAYIGLGGFERKQQARQARQIAGETTNQDKLRQGVHD